ncbi:MAG: hypothetical protein ACOCVF_00225 [bacterium]
MNKRIANSIKIINHAIHNGISVQASSVEHGFSKTYVKNAKAYLKQLPSNNKTISDSECDAFFNIYNKYLDSKLLAEETKQELKTDLKVAKKTNKESLTIKNDKGHIDIDSRFTNRVITLDDLLEKAKVDTELWRVKEHVINKWDVTSFKNGDPVVAENYQVKARLEKNQKAVKEKTFDEIFSELSEKYTPPLLTDISKPEKIEDNLLEVSIFDLHIGKLAWSGESGENYDSKIAKKRFMESITTLLERAKNFHVDRILFPVGNDFFNSDNKENTTTNGTPQDEDLRWKKTFYVGVHLLVDGINLLKQMGVPVDVIVIPGNHDFERSYYMGAFLDAWFRNDDMVSIDNSGLTRKYYVYGEVLLGFTHGGEEKQDALGMLMAGEKESKPYWSKTRFHEWHLGHQHRKKNVKYVAYDKGQILTEDMGVTVRYLSSLTGTEEWHYKKGFVGQIKAADAFVWNKQLGFVAHLNSNYIVE